MFLVTMDCMNQMVDDANESALMIGMIGGEYDGLIEACEHSAMMSVIKNSMIETIDSSRKYRILDWMSVRGVIAAKLWHYRQEQQMSHNEADDMLQSAIGYFWERYQITPDEIGLAIWFACEQVTIRRKILGKPHLSPVYIWERKPQAFPEFYAEKYGGYTDFGKLETLVTE